MTRRIRTRALLERQTALIALAVACVWGVARYVAFATPENIVNILRQNSVLALLALGMTVVILTGGIDLSVGSVLAVSGVAAAVLSPRGTLAAVVAGIGVAMLIGLVNGLLIAMARIEPFIVTLATMIAARGVALGLTGERSVPVSPAATGVVWLGRGWLCPLPVPVLVAGVAYALGALALRSTTFGYHVYAVGDDQEAARLLGLQVDRVLISTYTLAGALAGLAGVILAGRLGAGQPVAGMGWELDAIAAVVVGGTVLTGGQGGVGRTLVGVLLLGVILNLLNLEGTFSPWWQWVIRGGFLLAVVIGQGRLRYQAADA